MGLVNVACLAGAVILAERRGGRLLALATALFLVLSTRALPVEASYEILNSWAGLFPFVLMLFVACRSPASSSRFTRHTWYRPSPRARSPWRGW
jgi:hypothetical protein